MPKETATEKRQRVAIQNLAKEIYTVGEINRKAMQTEPEYPAPGIYRHFKKEVLYRVWCLARDAYVPEFVVIYNEVDRVIPSGMHGIGDSVCFNVLHTETNEQLIVYRSSEKWWVNHTRRYGNTFDLVGYARPLDSFIDVLDDGQKRFEEVTA